VIFTSFQRFALLNLPKVFILGNEELLMVMIAMTGLTMMIKIQGNDKKFLKIYISNWKF